jgi:hypothetical protein
MINIRRDNTVKKERWYAVTDKGLISGGNKEIVERKIIRLGAKEKIWLSDAENIRILTKEEKELADELW